MTVKEFEIQYALGSLSYMKWRIATNPNTPEEILTILSKDKYWLVRCGITLNPNTPKKVLTKLSKDKIWQVRNEAIHNPNWNKQ